jgi:hypothetical protein
MILSQKDVSLQVIRQHDHAELAGALARNWGNTRFVRPEPFEPAALAACMHDNGWIEWDNCPRVNPRTQRPYQFTEMPVHEHLTFYERGVQRVVAEDAYAGLLVNMHCVGLYNQRYGIDPSIPMNRHSPEEQAIVQEFRHRLEEQQRKLRESLSAPEQQVWINYKLLQIFDRFSLYLCMRPTQERQLGPAPLDYQGAETELHFRPVDEQTVVVEPYPFRDSPLPVTVKARYIPASDYASDEEVQHALAEAPEVTLRFRLRAER